MNVIVNLIIQMDTITGDNKITCKAQNINNQVAYVVWLLNNSIRKKEV